MKTLIVCLRQSSCACFVRRALQVAAEVNYLIRVKHDVLQSGHPEPDLVVDADSKLFAAAMITMPNGELAFDPGRPLVLMASNQAKGLHYAVVTICRPEIVCIIFKGRDQDEKCAPLYIIKKVTGGWWCGHCRARQTIVHLALAACANAMRFL